jgi:transcriptional regulator with XRE-family HTH domain
MDLIAEGVGRRLRALRQARGMTLADLAADTGFTAGYLSQIETGAALPALSALADIAASLGADITAFFPAEEAHSKVRVTRAGDARRIRFEQEAAQTEYTVLASRGSDAAFSALIARYYSGDPISYRHFGERFVYVRSGEGELEIAGEIHPLRAGTFVHYSSHQEHQLRVTSDAPLETVWLVNPPII